ncbi:MAG: hypothetical protein HGA80_04140 [Candidatus Omnitrophica bacterium]|nr:hypothetical protein [Candidatus Omnitrophota bacterium]
MRKSIWLLIYSFVLVVWLCPVRAWAGPAIDDGIQSARKMDSGHFSIFLSAGVDEDQLLKRLDIGPDHKILAGQTLQGAVFSPGSLTDLLDALFIWSCGVLDMNLYNYRGNIKIVKEPGQLGEVYLKLYGVPGHADKAFYIYETNTIYITEQDFTKEILGHEIAHAIISNFFVVQPPQKVAEVLAGYIEFQLRKLGGNRPHLQTLTAGAVPAVTAGN